MTLDIAFGPVGDLMVELIRPNVAGANVYGEAMPTGCRAHHHGYLMDDINAAAADLGGLLVTKAHLSAQTDLRYFGCRDVLGLHVELITDSAESRCFFELSARLTREWHGISAPVRSFSTAAPA